MLAVAGVSLTQTGTRRHLLDRLGDDRAEHLVLADVRAHVDAVHVRAREVELERVGARVLAGPRQRLPVVQLLVAARAGHDRGDQHLGRVRFLDPREPRDPPVERLVARSAPSSTTRSAWCPAAWPSRRGAPSCPRGGTWSSGPATLTTGCRPMVLVTTPPQPASKARMMLRLRLGRAARTPAGTGSRNEFP